MLQKVFLEKSNRDFRLTTRINMQEAGKINFHKLWLARDEKEVKVARKSTIRAH